MPYEDTLPTATDKVRAVLGDTSNDATTELLSDDHIDAVLAMLATFDAGVAFMANELAVRFAQKPGSVSLPSGLSVSWAYRVAEWRRIADNAARGGITNAATLSFVPVSYGATDADEFARPPEYWP